MKVAKLICLSTFMISFIFASCNKDKTQSLPTLSTTETKEITDTTALVGGIIISDGNASITVKGICWSTSANPTITDLKVIDNTEAVVFTTKLSGLKAGKTYHVRAFATNSIGTGYGLDTSFTSNSASPTVTTADVSSITYQSAISGGGITSDGGASITSRGVCWSTSQNPSITDSKTTDGTSTGNFPSTINKLNPNTLYYFRAYATNMIGTGYGAVKTFTTKLVSDYDGNSYNAVTIGTQVWLAENLKTIHYQNGELIANATNIGGTNWTSLTSGVYCDNTTEVVSNVYGRLYNWYAVTDSRKVCPLGWHVPTITEWNTLITFLGGESVTGGKLKEIGTTHWLDPNTGATDEVGFKAIAGGWRAYAGGFLPIGEDAHWWASTESNSSSAWNIWTRNTYINVNVVTVGKTLANSVRCIKD